MEPPIPTARRYTVAEYIALESAATEKHEYRDGEIVAMAGGTGRHSLVTANVIRRVGNALDGSECVVFESNLRVRTDRTRYCYPDVTVACQPLIYAPFGDEPEGILTNPQVVIEILSPSTEAADRGEKFTRYRNLDSLQEYVLVAQDRPQVEPFYRQPDGVWAIGKTVDGLDGVLRLRMGVELPLAQVYAGVTFPDTATEPIGSM